MYVCARARAPARMRVLIPRSLYECELEDRQYDRQDRRRHFQFVWSATCEDGTMHCAPPLALRQDHLRRTVQLPALWKLACRFQSMDPNIVADRSARKAMEKYKAMDGVQRSSHHL